ncbi:MotE family protein [Rhodoblastus acidophilus]|uniref:MotE family protein n=1 Tax=Candidatus Rhodoblastus alkanivorans TaxID=2954117 RepID=A0ABS9Z453_9HYPH|nr:MotE family protein [Candidatus Rhodoblastus alkanivorans]MCI4678826.1 MotE family protein [Candidatus Rhodoblastus alkanivorans]MCI4682215.1 MotE family protein [Candidatus Rhodoblastus alkanivorans]MDI4639517.1 MotE family protein [Rhodoblastus acidophilus]
MIRRLHTILTPLICLAALGPALANEGGGGKQSIQADPPNMPPIRQVPIRRPALSPIKPLAVTGMKGVANYCGAIANSAASARLAWQEQRIKTLQAELTVKIAELDAKTGEVRQWVAKREELLAKASANLIAIYSKMTPDAASAQLQDMDDDTAAALLLKMKPAVASAVMGEMDAARAARLSDLLTGATAKSEGKKS